MKCWPGPPAVPGRAGGARGAGGAVARGGGAGPEDLGCGAARGECREGGFPIAI